LLDAGTNRVRTLHVPVSFRKCQSDWAREYRKAADGITNDEQFLAESACPISAAGSGHRQRMQGWFWQIIIGIIVTVVGTIIANSIVRGPGTATSCPASISRARQGDKLTSSSL
jgi:hypothetical protein